MLFPWDAEGSQLWKAVTWTFVPRDGDKRVGFANYAAQDYDALIQLIETRAGRPDANVYIALGTQRMANADKTTTDGYPRAVRQITNVVSFNSVYLDIDVGKEGAYANTADAYAALDQFLEDTGMPEASMEVLSGSGGLHVYWCTKEPMPINAWTPLAKGLRDAAILHHLKIDAGVTVNAAGILRVPGTRNHKLNPPGEVRLLTDSSFKRYGYQELVNALGAHVGPLAGVRLSQARRGATDYASNFTEGVGGTVPPVPLDALTVNCGVISDIVDREGAGDKEPLWNMAMLVASFTDDPHEAAHRMSRGDKRYSHDDTEKKLLEKLNARAANPNLGWPKCDSFSTHHAACFTCPLFAQKKSPFNFAPRPAAAPPPNAAQPQGTDTLLPYGFWRDVHNHVFTVVQEKDGSARQVDVLGYPIFDAGIDPMTGNLAFLTRVSGIERWGNAHIAGNMTPIPAAQAMATGGGVFIKPINHKIARDFLVAWMTHLQANKRTINPVSYGWTKDGKGFTFDEVTYTETGKEVCFRGGTLDSRFASHGDLKPWQDACQLVYENPALEIIVASAFAAPLVTLAGPASVILSAYSAASGVGKTTAMMIAQSVWGDPRTGMSSLGDTLNSVMKKVADLQNLPIYWDELRTQDQLEKVIDLVFQITGGKGKSRLNRDASQMTTKAFTTMFACASNYGIADTVYNSTDGTEAGGLRVFEIQVEEHGPLAPTFSDWQARQMLRELGVNYGVAGARYAEFIAKNKKTVLTLLNAQSDMLNRLNKFSTKERFWAVTMATILTGARLANKLGLTKFNLTMMAMVLDEMLEQQRTTLKEESHTTLAAPDSVLSLLQEMMDDIRGKHLILTDMINYGTGRPGLVELIDTDPAKLQNVWMQVGVKDKRIRIRCKSFNDWMRKHGKQPKQVRKMLEKYYMVSRTKSTIGAGVIFLDALTQVGSGRAECYDLTPLPSFLGSSHGV